MTQVILGLGSNIDRENNLRAGLRAVEKHLDNMRVSPVYDCDAVGFEGDRFLNTVVAGDVSISVGALSTLLRDIEIAHGRAPNAPRFSSRTLDIDLLVYGDSCGEVDGVTLPREDMLKHAYVLRPLIDLLPQEIHPLTGQTYLALWEHSDFDKVPMRRVDFYDNKTRQDHLGESS